RRSLTNDGKCKQHDFGTGLVKWRNKARRVTVKGAEDVLKRLLKNTVYRDSFVRTKHEINKDALREKPEVANQIDGITVGAEGEDFVIEANFETTGDAA
ncbi:MAG: host-nuclease inhibitor Gam family protein, partial [Cohaesibacter sp.]|nr:host-nuclease inhibitor Gam family protein [Cohaesibacter sp.]